MFTPSKYYNLIKRKIGNTQSFEKEWENFENEYNRFTEFTNSTEFLRLKELNSWAEAKEHEKIKKQLAALTYKKSEEYKFENELIRITKSSDFRDYQKHTKSGIPELFNTVKDSGKIEKLAKLESFVNSSDYKNNRKQYKKDNSDEYQKELEYNKLKSDIDLKKFHKLEKDKSLQNYFRIQNSSTLNRYNELKGIVESAGFVEKKKYLQSNDKFKQSEAFAMLEERKKLQKSEAIVWYEKTLKSNKFKGVEDRKISFDDNFDTATVDGQKWLTKFYWGDKFLNTSYSFSANGHGYTDNNVEQGNGSLKIITRKEQSEGLAWDAKLGFVPKKFNYTSGTINTGKTYRQTRGRVDAKVKMSCAKGVYHTMYLVGDKMLPQLDVFCKNDADTTSINAGFYLQKGKKTVKNIKAVRGIDLNEPNIFTIEWDDKKIYWAINGAIVKAEKNIAQGQPLYIVLASGVNGQVEDNALPAKMEVEWVKCWSI